MNARNQSLRSLSMLIIITMAASLAQAQAPEDWQEQDTVMVGRISHIEGELSRYDPESDDWAATTREAPFGSDDIIQTESGSKAEFIMPNNTWARIDGDTRIQLVVLDDGHTEIDLQFGKARLYNKSAETQMVATTPYGIVSAPPGSAFDLYVQENAVEVIALHESVYFVQNASRARHEIRAGASALFADGQEVTATQGEVAHAWHNWNREMDRLWAARINARGESATYLPPALLSDAYALDTHGRWERVYYDNAYYRFWRPVHVRAGWAPFTSGAWMVWHGDHVWIPSEPFGYVTHHYGNWIFAAGFWYWAPPVTRVMVHARLPLLRIGFGWYPGRVTWIHSGTHVGWITLGPYEPYYTHRHWGRRSIVLSNNARFEHRSNQFKHHRHAVLIQRNRLYRSRNYTHDSVRPITNGTIGNRFHAAPVPDKTVTKEHFRLHKENRFKPTHQTRKPHPAVTGRMNGHPPVYAKSTAPHGPQQSAEDHKVQPNTNEGPPARVRQAEKHGPAKRFIDGNLNPKKRTLSRKQSITAVQRHKPATVKTDRLRKAGDTSPNRQKPAGKNTLNAGNNRPPAAPDRKPGQAIRPPAREGQSKNDRSNRGAQLQRPNPARESLPKAGAYNNRPPSRSIGPWREHRRAY